MDAEQLPHARPKERELLAGLIEWPAGLDVLNGLEPKHFTSPANKKIFAEMVKRRAKSHSWDRTDFALTDDAGHSVTPLTSTKFEQTAEALQNTYARRLVVQLAKKLAKDAYDEDKDPVEALRSASESLGRIRHHAAKADALSLTSVQQLLAKDWPEPTWIVPDVLPVGLTIFAGKSKKGKSWLAMQIASAVGTGAEILGRRAERRKVLLLALEDNERRLASRIRKQQWSRDADVDFMTLRPFMAEIGDLKNGGGDRLAAAIEDRGYSLVIIDTLSRSVYGDQNDVEKMTRALAPIQSMAFEHDCAVFMIDHHNKMTAQHKDVMIDILGSTAKGAVSDTGWGIYRDRGQQQAELMLTGRDVLDQTLALEWDPGHGKWLYQGNAVEIEMTKRRQEITEAIREFGPMTTSVLREACGQDQSILNKRLLDLCDSGVLIREKKGKTFLYSLPISDDIPI